MPRPLLLGHRGARAVKSIPENTFASFDRALTDGCEGFEFDVRLTRDGKAVVSHDPTVGKIQIARATSQQLPGLVGLHDVLDRYRKAFLDIELKVAGLEKIVVEALNARERQNFVVSSFLPEVLTTLHASDATIPLGLICETKAQLRLWKELPVGSVIPHQKIVQQDLIGELHDSGKRLLVWTVNSADMIKRFADWGVDGIISDNPKRLVATLK
jgi:glycerophosphoryl diester phosphodiesterase